MHSIRRRMTGFSLVELMVALVAGLIVAAAAVSFLLSSMRSNGEYVQSTRLTQELRNTLDLVTRELRRAGYDDDALAYLGTPNMSPFSPLQLTAGGTAASCVIYAYDRSFPNGAAAVTPTPGALDIGNGEVRGLRRIVDATTGRGVIEYAESAGTASPRCTDAQANYATYPPSCVGNWCALSDPKALDITSFNVTDAGTLVGSGASQMKLRKLDVAITGKLLADTFTRTVQSSIKVRADCLRIAIADCDNAPTP